MQHLHLFKAMHRDIKLANIFLHFPYLVGKENLINYEWIKNVNLLNTEVVVKIGDLGFSKLYD